MDEEIKDTELNTPTEELPSNDKLIKKLNLKVKLTPYTTRKVVLKTKLTAYTRGIIPDVSNFIEDAPKDDFIYGRVNGTWENISKAANANKVLIDKNSGLNREALDEDDSFIKLSVRKWEGWEHDLPEKLEEDTVYYAIDDKPDVVFACGTAFSDEEETYGQILSGGNLKTTLSQYECICVPMNAKGEYGRC